MQNNLRGCFFATHLNGNNRLREGFVGGFLPGAQAGQEVVQGSDVFVGQWMVQILD